MAAHRLGGIAFGIAGAAVALWMTFVPWFLFIFTGAPFIDRLTAHAAPVRRTGRDHGRGGRRDRQPVALVRAACASSLRCPKSTIGPMHLTWPDLGSLRPIPALIAILAAVTLLWRHWPLSVGAGPVCGRLGAGNTSVTQVCTFRGARPFPWQRIPYAKGTSRKGHPDVALHRLRHTHAPRDARSDPDRADAMSRSDGLPGAHHFFITFDTTYPGVELADWLRERYPTR